jgi:hypothetical protein
MDLSFAFSDKLTNQSCQNEFGKGFVVTNKIKILEE